MYSREVLWPGAPSQTPSSLDRWEYLSLTYYCPQQPEREPPPSRAPGARSPGSTLHRASFAQGILTEHPHRASSASQPSTGAQPGPSQVSMEVATSLPVAICSSAWLRQVCHGPVCLRELPLFLSHRWVLRLQPGDFSAAVSELQTEPFPPPLPRDAPLQHACPSTSCTPSQGWLGSKNSI